MPKKIFLTLLAFFLLLLNSNCSAISLEVSLQASPTPQGYIAYFFEMAMLSGGILAVIILVFSGIQLIYSAGNPEKTSEAKKRAISAVLGLTVLLSSFLIIQTINPKLKNLDPTEQLRILGKFWFWGGTDGPVVGKKSGCGINQCLGLDGTCSSENCGGFDYGDCPWPSGCPDSDGNCSVGNCISSKSGCGSDQCLGLDGSCSGGNCNGNIVKPAPIQLENIDEIKKKYGFISWQETGEDLSGNTISHCDPNNPNAVYVAYLYKDYNFKNLFSVKRIRCGGWVDIYEANSYMLIKETPGVYFYGNNDCYPKGDTPPAAITESIPEGWNDEVRSMRIVNGPDSNKGPFFGLIYFNDYDYKTNGANPIFLHIGPRIWRWSQDSEIVSNNYSYCYNVGSIRNGSWVIYQWVGFEENGQTFARAGDGVTLHSKTGWLGGYNQIKDVNFTPPKRWFDAYLSMTTKNLKQTPVFYLSESRVPPEEQALCSKFNTDSSCLKSFEIKGNYLVLVSSEQDFSSSNYGDLAGLISIERAHAQAFPISPRLQEAYKDREGYSVEKGTPELTLDYIGWLKQAQYIEVIPLAGKSN
ncbi:MAG: pilin [Patescibacteria group bacterium]